MGWPNTATHAAVATSICHLAGHPCSSAVSADLHVLWCNHAHIFTSWTSCGMCGMAGTCSGKPISASETRGPTGASGFPEMSTSSTAAVAVLVRAAQRACRPPQQARSPACPLWPPPVRAPGPGLMSPVCMGHYMYSKCIAACSHALLTSGMLR